MEENTFYDIHTHAMNLSHPYLLAFTKRLKMDQILMVNSVFGMFTSWMMRRYLNKIKNLLSVMENDVGSFFLLMENCLREADNPLLRDDGLYIGGNVYTRIVLTPLMMDFGKKDLKFENIHYNVPSKKPIIEQVTDVFNGIRKYKNTSSDGLSEIYPSLGPDTNRILEIYPFLGLNTRNYDVGEISEMLVKYFGSYNGSCDDLFNNMGQFDGDIYHLGSGFFAGIKVYPPLGFDPWPDDEQELEKVVRLYSYCCEKSIPITAHCSDGGFVAVEKQTAQDYTAPSKWKTVLGEYPKLKLNLAHFGRQGKALKIFPKREWVDIILDIMSNSEYENLYVDFSNRAVDDEYYGALRNLIDDLSDEQQKRLKKRILFGSDFMINLLSLESYNKYLDIFSRNASFTREEKNDFCCTNPERFLFS